MTSKLRLFAVVCLLQTGSVWAQTVVPDAVGASIGYTFVEVGDPQNPDDDATTPAGSARGKDFENAGVGYVGQAFAMGQSEVTNEMYVRFLNAVASRDRLYGLYSDRMSPDKPAGGGIRRAGTPQSGYTYTVEPGLEQHPVSFVSGFDAMRFCNWLHNGMPGDPQAVDPSRRTPLTGDQDASSTEDGAYTLLGANTDEIIRRNPGAKYFLPDQDEWHKAAYYDPSPGPTYWWFADQTYVGPGGNYNTVTINGSAYRDLARVMTSAPASHYGTYDQDGNVNEWLDASTTTTLGNERFYSLQEYTEDAASGSFTVSAKYATQDAVAENRDLGFRVARPLSPSSVPSWDFVYELNHVNEPAADTYVFASSNVRKYSEWQTPPVTYWGPSANGVDASITFRFPFARPATRAEVRADLASFNFSGGGGLGSGSCSLWASKDGVNWELLLDNPAPATIDSYKTFHDELPISLIGAAELWIQVRFRVEGAPNTTYTDAQFSRGSSAATSPVFALRADYSDAIVPLMVEIGGENNLADEEYSPELGDPKLGAVNNTFQMGAYEVTNRDYAKFLNAKAKEDSFYRLFDTRMESDSAGGISRSGTNGNYVYTVKPGMARKPVVYVSIFTAMRYCNWLHNGGRTKDDTDVDMESGAYRLLGNIPPNTENLTRNAAARYYLPNANEFYKAAYYDPNAVATFNYWKFATRSDTFNATNNNAQLDDVDFSGMASYFGTYGQSGNVGYVNPGSGPNTPAPKPTAANTGELLEEATNTDDESASRTFRIAAAADSVSLHPLGDEDGDGLLNGWEVLNGLNHLSTAGPNGAGSDPDGDRLTNLEEQTAGTYADDDDTDNDGLTDGAEVNTHTTDPKDSDTDNDGLSDGAEVNAHTTDPKDSDTDNDGLIDGAEVNEHGSNPKLQDTDNDGLGDAVEVNKHQTNPANVDTDGDVIPDGWEVQYTLNPLVNDAAGDVDTDALTNLQEFNAGSDPKKPDTDGDGIPDKWEVDNTFNPANASDAAGDADGDGLTNLREFQLGTLPRNADSEGDGMPDGWEVQYTFNPLVNEATGDADSDGLTNLREFQLGTLPKDSDTDNDLVGDGEEVNSRGTDPLKPDTDSDGLTDYQELFVFGTNPLAATPVPNVPIFRPVGDPQNPDDDGGANDVQNAGRGYVGQEFGISVTEVTNEMYALFLNSIAKRDRLYGLYKADMGKEESGGGIDRTGSQGSYVYTVKAGFATKPVNFVSLWDVLRYINWLHNWKVRDEAMRDAFRPTLTGTQDQNAVTTEDGVYALRGTNPVNFARHPDAHFFLPDVDEWHKAAYYDPDPATGKPAESYWDRATQKMGSKLAAATAPLVPVGTAGDAYFGPSHYGTYDQDGNVEEWVQEALILGGRKTSTAPSETESASLGFRVAQRAADYAGTQKTVPLLVEVGEPGNSNDPEFSPELGDPKLGAVSYAFQMGAYEVTNREYAKFLNVKAKGDDFYALYDTRMGTDSVNGGIIRIKETSGDYRYEPRRGMALKPVVYVSIFSAMRYCNWLHNGGGEESDMEDGVYRLLGNIPPNTENLTRNATARYYLPNAAEFYKAAYFDISGSAVANATAGYWKFATRSDTNNTTNNKPLLDDVDFTSIASYFGTYGQSGNVGFLNPGSGVNTPAPKPTAANTGELLEEATNTDDESATRTFRVAAAAGSPFLRPLGDEDSDGLKNGWEALNDLDPRSGAGIHGASGDPDNDGLTNSEEQLAKTNPRDNDTDIDDLTDFEELRTYLTDPKDSDTDNDGLTDGAEVKTHFTNPKDSDTDDDGLSDGAEVNEHGSNPKVADTDGDGLGDAAEVNNHQTNPANGDTDGDGMRDGWEVQYNFNPKDPADAALDADSDGLTNLQEFVAGSNPRNGDTDGDGLGDKWEVDNLFNPVDKADGAQDADSDGLTNLRELQFGTKPRNPDTDGDGMLDGWEVQNGLNPLVNDAAQDPDGDGLTNLREFQLGTNPKNRDTDGDRIGDGEENVTLLTSSILSDTDGDGLTDYQELYVFRSNPLAAGAIPNEPSFVSVGDPGNPDEDIEGQDLENAGIGYVGQAFEIGVSEVTNLMYAKFLNAVGKSDAIYGLYSAEMGSSPRGGIERKGLNGSYIYTVKPGFETRPVNYVSAFDAMRYCNWLHNGMPATGVQNASTTEDGAYKLDGMNRPEMVRRSFGAKYFLPDQDEWHKAAYYDPAGPFGASQDYWFFADRSSVGPGGNFAPDRNRRAGTTSDPSHYGTFDQDGNIREWLDASLTGSERLVAGGGCDVEPVENDPDLVLVTRNAIESEDVLAEELDLGFRVARAVDPAPSAPDFLPTMVKVGVPGNPADSNGKGRVNYEFQIGAYEVTNEEYADFLNAVAKDDSPYNLYDIRMDSGLLGGIQRTGSPGSYFYEAKTGSAHKPVNYVTFYNAMRYCNWLHNGARPGSDTETGAYRLLGNLPPDTALIGRNFGARYFLPNENEWYKAAYYDPSAAAQITGNYWRFAVRLDNATSVQVAVGGFAGLVEVSRPGIASYFGSFGQNGNAAEWSETFSGGQRLVLGGGIDSDWSDPAAAMSFAADPTQVAVDRGFRIAARSDSPAARFAFPQSIQFSRLPTTRTLGTKPLRIALRASASSSLPVEFEVSGTAGIATLSGGTKPYLLVTGPGVLTITARQSGGGAWAAAAPAPQTIQILPRPLRSR